MIFDVDVGEWLHVGWDPRGETSLVVPVANGRPDHTKRIKLYNGTSLRVVQVTPIPDATTKFDKICLVERYDSKGKQKDDCYVCLPTKDDIKIGGLSSQHSK